LIFRRHDFTQILIAFGVLATGLLASVPGTAEAGTGSISGKVTMAGTGAAMAEVEVCAYPIGWRLEPDEEGFAGGCTHTAADGTYTLANLTSVSYEVEFKPDPDKFIQQKYLNEPTGTPTSDLVKVESAPVTGIDAVIQWPARLEGTVTATADGLPVKGVEVCAYNLNGWGAYCDWTAGDGTYSIKVWGAGEYEIEFGSGKSGRNLAIQLYDHVDRIEEAQRLSVSLSEVIGGLNADLEPGGTISGHITHSTAGEWQEEVQVCSIDATTDEIWTCVWSNRAGDYALRFLSPGPYKVVFAPERTFPETEVEVPSGFPTQFWNYTTSLAAANVVSLEAGEGVSGVDAWLGVPKPPPLSTTPLTSSPPAPASGPQVQHKCRRGFHRKAGHGTVRCVKRHKRRHSTKLHRRSTSLRTPQTN
jgi:hypothetical protein